MSDCKRGHQSLRNQVGDCVQCHRGRSRAWRELNKDMVKDEKRRYRAKNKDKIKESNLRWNAANQEKRRALRKNYKTRRRLALGSFGAEDVARIYKDQGGKCVYCRVRLGRFHIDHIYPLSKGGSNYPENLQLTCEPCNLSKRDKDPIEYAHSLGFLI